MTYKEFKTHYFENMYSEIEFLNYDEFVGELNTGKVWYTTQSFINHGKRFKRLWHEHMYNLRTIDYSTLKY